MLNCVCLLQNHGGGHAHKKYSNTIFFLDIYSIKEYRTKKYVERRSIYTLFLFLKSYLYQSETIPMTRRRYVEGALIASPFI